MRAPAGLCDSCRHALLRPTRRGTVYLRCGLAATDPRFAKYPVLPVLRCPGYQLPCGAPGNGGAGSGSGGPGDGGGG